MKRRHLKPSNVSNSAENYFKYWATTFLFNVRIRVSPAKRTFIVLSSSLSTSPFPKDSCSMMRVLIERLVTLTARFDTETACVFSTRTDSGLLILPNNLVTKKRHYH